MTLMRSALLLQLLLGGTYFLVVRPVLAQTQDGINERYSATLGNHNVRIDQLENLHVDARLRVLEESMLETKWLGRAVAAGVIGQILMALFERQKLKGA